MISFVTDLFDTSAFPARWYCGEWTAQLGWLHILSDLGTWSAYTAIPAVLCYFILRRKDLPMPRVFWLFVAFIFACGTVHLVEAVIFWWPIYRISGIVKFFTAVVSWITVISLIRITPMALRLPGLAVLNADLQRANDELNEFAHVVSHDLRAPLRSIHSLANWIQEDLQNLPPEAAENLRLMKDRVQRLDEMVEGILAYSRAGRNCVALETFSAAHAAQNAVDDLHIPEGIRFRMETPLPTITYNAVQFRQLIQNLVQNAVQYMGSTAGEIVLFHADQGSHWAFGVRDTGIGIAPEHHDRIFRVFQTLAPREEGIGGVGLSVVKKIVEYNDGRIWVDSSLGRGATFHFTLPKQPRRLQESFEGPMLAESA